MSKFLSTCFLLAPFVLFSSPAVAQTVEQRLTAVETATKAAQSAGDNAWMLTCAALVLMMTGPGLALFYGGLVRRKNVLSTMMHSFALMAVVTVLWAIYGYSNTGPATRRDFGRPTAPDLGKRGPSEKVSEASTILLRRAPPGRTVAQDLVVTNVSFVHM